MSHCFSAQFKHETWRKLWIALAEAEKELGLDISHEQIDELKSHSANIDFAAVQRYEAELHHDVMAHIHAYGDLCPKARPIIHLGATSCYVTDNTDTIQQKRALSLIEQQLVAVIRQLAAFAARFKGTPCLGYTHFQPAQPTTVGKRACLWIQDFAMDLADLRYYNGNLKFLGVKGTTGTQASFLALFSQDDSKVAALDRLVADKMGFSQVFPVTGQTYTRKQDAQILHLLARLAASAHKFATDLRLLAGLKEMEEPFGEKQIGSSAMPYKRNPMLSERICSLGRFVIALAQNGDYTHATQWLERSLDDSANRRLTLSEAFLASDAILNLLLKVTDGLVVNERIIAKRIAEELPFMATENILMAAVKKGGDRQALHEAIRVHSHAAAKAIKEEGGENDLLARIASDPAFKLTPKEIESLLQVEQFTGRAAVQVTAFLETLELA